MSKDERRAFILEEIDGEAFYQEYFPDIEFGLDGQTIENVLCPFHDGVSLSINKHDGWKCWGCDKKGDLITFYRLVQKNPMSDEQAMKKLYSRYIHPIPNIKEQNLWHKYLMRTPGKIQELKARRGIDIKAVQLYEIGYDQQDKSYTVPIMGPNGFYHDIRKIRIDLPPEQSKYKNRPYDYGTAKSKKSRGEITHGYGGRLFPYKNLQCDTLILCEGEFDCILLNMLGFPAVTTGSCTSWKKWYPDLKGKHSIICFDNDDPRKNGTNAGQVAAEELKGKLFSLCKSVKNIVFPMYGDVTDYFVEENHTKEDFQALLDEGKKSKKPEPVETQEIEKEFVVVDSISDITSSKYYGKYVEVTTQVVGEGKKEYSIVTDFTLACNMDWGGPCEKCAMLGCSGKMKGKISPFDTNNKFLSYMDMKDKDLIADISATKGIAKGCPLVEIKRNKVVSLQKVVVAPEVKRTRIKKSDSGPVVYNMTGTLELNQSHILRGIVTHNPKDQTHCMLADYAKKVKSNSSNFRKMSEKELADIKSKFNPKTKNSEDIVAKFDEIMELHAHNLTNIYGRRDLHSFIDLTFHSPLQFIFDGVLERSYIETIVIGDTDTGKNKVLDALTEFYEEGIVVDSGACTKVGLLGGVNKAGEFSWGLYPRQHGKFLGLDEGKHLKGTIGTLRNVREGKADYFTAEGKRQTLAMVRAIILANDPNGVLSSNPFAIMALASLFEEEADISRFTLACFLKKEEVDIDKVNQLKPPAIKTGITQEDFQKVLANAWTVPPENIHFTSKAIAEIYKQAKRSARKYSDTIPLVQAATQWKKIAIVAAALAARLFNMSKDGTTLIICKNYVKASIKLIERHYDSDECGYKQFSEQEREKETIVSKAKIKKEIFDKEEASEDGDLDYTIKQLLAVREFNVNYYSDCFTIYLGPMDALESLKILIRNNCIVRKDREFIKTKAFVKYLKEVQNAKQQKNNKEKGGKCKTGSKINGEAKA